MAGAYEELLHQWMSLAENERDFDANTAQFVALLKMQLTDISWVGFYWLKGGDLVVGHYQGPVACSRFPQDKGVCGRAVTTREIQLVPDVHEFPGHIACDAKARSELVIPVFSRQNDIIGVLDLDSYSTHRFSEVDALGLARMVEQYVACTDFDGFPRGG